MGMSFGKLVLALTLAVFLVLFSLGPAPCQATTWTNLSEGDWHQLSNWDPVIPTSTTDAFINNAGTAQIVNGDAAAKNLTLGDAEGAEGLVKLINNYKLVTSGGLAIGFAGGGSFYQFDGGVTSMVLSLGRKATGKGSYYLEKGTLIVAEPQSGSMYVGREGTGLFQQTGGEVTVYNRISLGDFAGARGDYILENGSLTMPLGYFYIGNEGIGSFDQKRGAVTLNSYLLLGGQEGSQGDYFLKDGTLTVGQVDDAKYLNVGPHGIGRFQQDGGAVTVNGNLYLGYWASGSGSYVLTDGSLTINRITTSHLYVGIYGKGDFQQSGGEVTVNGPLMVGGEAGGEGIYSLSAGALTVGQASSPATFALGGQGNGEFQQQGGHVTAYGDLYLGNIKGAEGKYFIKDGTLTAGQPGGLYNLSVGENGKGSFEQQGGSVTSRGHLYIGNARGAEGSYLFADGNLAVGEAANPSNMCVGRFGTGSFHQQGGKATVYGNVFVAADSIFSQTGGTFVANQNFENKGQVAFDNSGGTLVSTAIGNMTNYGAVKVTSTTVTFNNYTEHGSYTSDPSTTIIVRNMTVEATGFLLGEIGDLWRIGNDFLNTSTKNTDWNTNQATLVFFQSEGQDTKHTLQVPGVDKGPSPSGYSDNFAWGTMDVTGQELSLLDDGVAGGALYLRSIAGLEFDPFNPLHILNIDSLSGMNLYYDPAFNPGLSGIYSLDGGGTLAPAVPLPGSVWLMLSGLAGLAALRRWRN